jgi:hypothetical protein
MSKSKFILTNELINVEPEPQPSKENSKKVEANLVLPVERLSLNIDAKLKKELHLFCVSRRKKMTEIVERALEDYLRINA